jgi:nucleotidyltransferase/DNA polymerase involved in DNA repair
MTWIAVVRIPRFPIAVVRRDEPALAEQPLLLVANRGGQTIVVAASEPSVALGETLRRAQLLCPDALVRPHDPACDQAALLELRMALDPISPHVALLATQPDVAFSVDLGRLSATQAHEVGLLLAQRVSQRLGIVPAIGVATSQTVAHLAAHIAPHDTPLVVPAGMETAWLAPHPVELLPIDPTLVTRLHQFGLGTIGAVATLPCDALEAQFGRAGRELFDLAHGRDPLPFTAPSSVPPLIVGRRFTGPVADVQILDAALAQIAARLASRLLRHGQAARHLTLALTVEHDPPIEAQRALAEPTADPARLQALLGALLRERKLEQPCEQLTVTVEPAAIAVTQRELFAPVAAEAGRLEATLARLAVKHGAQFLQATLADPEARCLERRVRLTPREER